MLSTLQRPAFSLEWVKTLCSRENLSAVSFAVAIICVLTEPTLISPVFYYYPIFIYIGVRLVSKKLQNLSWSKEVILCSFIALSSIVAIPFSPFFEDHNWAATLFHAALTLILVPLLFIPNVKQIFYALIPFAYWQASLMVWQWFAIGSTRAQGLALNANAGSSFLLLIGIFLVTQPKYKWLSVPLFIAITLSGSRWVAVVGIIVLSAIFISRHVPWRYVCVGIAVSMGVFFGLQNSHLIEAYRIGESAGNTAQIIQDHVAWRLTSRDDLLSFSILIPKGFINSQLHNVPVRMATETGLLSGLAWLVVGALVLIKRPPYTYSWWMLLAVCLLSGMYYFTWIGPLGAFWWLLVGDLRKAKVFGSSVSLDST